MLFILFRFLIPTNLKCRSWNTKRTLPVAQFSHICCVQGAGFEVWLPERWKMLGKQGCVCGRNLLLPTILWLSYQSLMKEGGSHWRKALQWSDWDHRSHFCFNLALISPKQPSDTTLCPFQEAQKFVVAFCDRQRWGSCINYLLFRIQLKVEEGGESLPAQVNQRDLPVVFGRPVFSRACSSVITTLRQPLSHL